MPSAATVSKITPPRQSAFLTPLATPARPRRRARRENIFFTLNHPMPGVRLMRCHEKVCGESVTQSETTISSDTLVAGV